MEKCQKKVDKIKQNVIKLTKRENRKLKEEKIIHYINCGKTRKLLKYFEDEKFDINKVSDVYSCVCENHRKDQFSLMHYAASHADPKLVLLLEKYGADINQLTASGQTPLMLAVLHDNIDNILTLCMLKCDKNAVDDTFDGNTALHHACRYGKTDIVKELLELKTDTNIKNKRDKTPLELAKENNHQQIVEFLFEQERRLSVVNQAQIREELSQLKQTMESRMKAIEAHLGSDGGDLLGACRNDGDFEQPIKLKVKTKRLPTQDPDSSSAEDTCSKERAQTKGMSKSRSYSVSARGDPGRSGMDNRNASSQDFLHRDTAALPSRSDSGVDVRGINCPHLYAAEKRLDSLVERVAQEQRRSVRKSRSNIQKFHSQCELNKSLDMMFLRSPYRHLNESGEAQENDEEF